MRGCTARGIPARITSRSGVLEMIQAGPGAKLSQFIRWRYPEKCKIGTGSIIDDFCYISCALKMGKNSHISANCTLFGGGAEVRIGSFVDIGPGCQIMAVTSNIDVGLSNPAFPDSIRQVEECSPILIDDFCLLGAQTIVLPGVFLPIGVASGAMTLFTNQEYDPWTIYTGVPARPLRKRTGEEHLLRVFLGV